MSRKALFTKRRRRVAALGAAGLGACAVLAACSPVQVGAAAIVGSQRITVSSLDTQVSNWQTAAKPYASTIQIKSTDAPAAVLSWLVRFAVQDQVAAANGISVTQAQSQAGLSSLSAVAQQNGFLKVSLKSGIADYSFIPAQLIAAGFAVNLLREEEVNLETAFMRLTKGIVQ